MSRTSLEKLGSLSRTDLHNLAAGLDSSASDRVNAIEKCVEFVLADTKGLGHGRARALMCRRLKHCALDSEQRHQLVACITDRLAPAGFPSSFEISYDSQYISTHSAHLKLRINTLPDRRTMFEGSQLGLSKMSSNGHKTALPEIVRSSSTIRLLPARYGTHNQEGLRPRRHRFRQRSVRRLQ